MLLKNISKWLQRLGFQVNIEKCWESLDFSKIFNISKISKDFTNTWKILLKTLESNY